MNSFRRSGCQRGIAFHVDHVKNQKSSRLGAIEAQTPIDRGRSQRLVREGALNWINCLTSPLGANAVIESTLARFQVNFSKKRKNRMRNDEAAIIALSKSRSQFLHKDTDSLVDNEAVIVYDERTAL